MMGRRAFIGIVGGGMLAVPPAAEAQQPKVYRIGLLGGSSPTDPGGRVWEAFFQGLRELGYVEGQNFRIEGRWYGEQPERLQSLAADLVRVKVEVIVAGTAPAPEAAVRATSTIPIVMASHPDPVGSGLAVSLAKPGRNVTGLSSLTGTGQQAVAVAQGRRSRNLPRGRTLESDGSSPKAQSE